MRRSRVLWGAMAVLMAGLIGCGGDDGAQGPAGPTGPAGPAGPPGPTAQAVNPETCVTCHVGDSSVARTGPGHQAIYADFYQDGVVVISEMAFAASGTTATLSFKMTKNGAAFDCTKPTGSSSDFAIGSYWAAYDAATKTFTANQSLAGTKTYNATTNVCTFTQTVTAAQVAQMVGNGIVQIYGVDEIVERNAAKRLSIGKFPFAGVLKVGTVDFSSAANVAGCENCHTKPYLKHAYIYGNVGGLEFYTCKGCHYDTRNGGHLEWQILKDSPARFAEIDAGSAITDAERAKYAYKAKLMNDVHMSHAMEFAYPQSMKNCVTCHAGKLDTALADNKFKAETCKSCHAVDGLKTIMSGAVFPHTSIVDNPDAADCTQCHNSTGAIAPSFKTIHNGGYDPAIYSATGARYSDTFVAKIDNVAFANNSLTIKFSATGTLGSMSAANIDPTIIVALYGYDSKDFLIAAHGRDADGKRNLEYVWEGSSNNPLTRFTKVGKTTASGTTTWEIRVDLSLWASQIGATKEIRRAEIGILPALEDAGGLTVGLNAVSRTFDFAKNAFDDAFYSQIVKVEGCNTCHDQLATTFHSGNRGGSIVVCRMCHVVSSGASHLELQSRSIDSYVHGVHSFQAFDPGDIDFGDPAESVAYKHHISTDFPRFGILNCESCHIAGMYNVPNQARSMPGVLSPSDSVEGRQIANIPAQVTGPAVRACGACHRAQAVNNDDSAQLAVLNQHFKTFGYALDDEADLWESVVAKIMALFNKR